MGSREAAGLFSIEASSVEHGSTPDMNDMLKSTKLSSSKISKNKKQKRKERERERERERE